MSAPYPNGHQPVGYPQQQQPNNQPGRPLGMSLEQATQMQIRQQAEQGGPRGGPAHSLSPFPPNPPGAPHPGFALHQQQQAQAALAAQQRAAAAALASRPAVPPPAVHGPVDSGPPYQVPVWPLFSRTSYIEPGLPFPSVSLKDQSKVKHWMEVDLAYERDLRAVEKAKAAEVHALGEELSRAQDWMGAEGPRARFGLRLEKDRIKERDKGKRGSQRKELPLSKAKLVAVAKEEEVLIPIRLEWEHEAYRLRDTFTWNLRDTMVTPEIFASHLCEDLRLPHNAFYKEIVSQIKRHIEEAQMSIGYDGYLAEDLSAAREENRDWFERQAKLRAEEVEVMDDDREEEQEMVVEQFAPITGMSPELRVTIKLDITLDSIQLLDRFEWDLSNPTNSPEQFAATFAADLGLGGEFETAIAHSIREQLDIYTKSLCILGYTKGTTIPDEELRREFLPTLSDVFRPNAPDLGPLLNALTADEVDRNDKEREREVRRKRRQTKGRGVTLPDRDPVKTHRTIVPKPSTVPLQSYVDQRGDMVYPMAELHQPFPLVADEVPLKPAGLEPVGASPLRLVLAKAPGVASAVPNPTHVPVAHAGRFKRKAEVQAEVAQAAAADQAAKKKLKPVDPAAYGLHEHIVDGAWHCARCGCPAALAVGRRKGPTGEATLCGTCGKYFHRYRKNRPCEYTTDFAFHQAFVNSQQGSSKTRAGRSRAVPKRSAPAVGGGGVPASVSFAATTLSIPPDGLSTVPGSEGTEGPSGFTSQVTSVNPSRQPSVEHSDEDEDDHSDEDDEDEHSDASSSGGKVRAPPRRAGHGIEDEDEELPYVRVGSPDSDHSSRRSPSPPPPRQPQAPIEAPAPLAAPERAAYETTLPKPEPLPWMLEAAAALRAEQPKDRFEITPRPRPADPALQEWRVRCLDCPGKLYNLGPGETLNNFSVHFKNRQHIANVEARLQKG